MFQIYISYTLLIVFKLIFLENDENWKMIVNVEMVGKITDELL